MQLCYKAWDPLKILEGRMLKASVLDSRSRGLSMTENLRESGHGPFDLIFRPDLAWYSQFTKCTYGAGGQITELNKPQMFAVEKEWWSPVAVEFTLADIERVVFMVDSPGARIYPRKTRRIWKELTAKYGAMLILETDNSRYPVDQ